MSDDPEIIAWADWQRQGKPSSGATMSDQEHAKVLREMKTRWLTWDYRPGQEAALEAGAAALERTDEVLDIVEAEIIACEKVGAQFTVLHVESLRSKLKVQP